jgi:hypothetical protein
MTLDKPMISDGDFFDYAKEINLSVKQEQEILDLIHRREETAFDRGKAFAGPTTAKGEIMEELKKYTILGFEWFNGGPFNNTKQTTVVKDALLRDDLANALFDYEVESIKSKKTNFIALSMFDERSVRKIREYDPENILNTERRDAEYSMWCD